MLRDINRSVQWLEFLLRLDGLGPQFFSLKNSSHFVAARLEQQEP